MSYIPDTRERIRTPLYEKSDICEPNAYWQGYLNEHNAQFVAGYDWCITQVIEYLLDEFEVSDDIRNEFLAHAESSRDELIVSMIDNMKDDECRRIVEEADNGYENILYRYGFEQDTIDNGYIIE